MNVRNQWVHFRIRDVYYPDPNEILRRLHGEDLLRGRVIDLSDSGDASSACAVVEVAGLEQPVVVPITGIVGAV